MHGATPRRNSIVERRTPLQSPTRMSPAAAARRSPHRSFPMVVDQRRLQPSSRVSSSGANTTTAKYRLSYTLLRQGRLVVIGGEVSAFIILLALSLWLPALFVFFAVSFTIAAFVWERSVIILVASSLYQMITAVLLSIGLATFLSPMSSAYVANLKLSWGKGVVGVQIFLCAAAAVLDGVAAYHRSTTKPADAAKATPADVETEGTIVVEGFATPVKDTHSRLTDAATNSFQRIFAEERPNFFTTAAYESIIQKEIAKDTDAAFPNGLAPENDVSVMAKDHRSPGFVKSDNCPGTGARRLPDRSLFCPPTSFPWSSPFFLKNREMRADGVRLAKSGMSPSVERTNTPIPMRKRLVSSENEPLPDQDSFKIHTEMVPSSTHPFEQVPIYTEKSVAARSCGMDQNWRPDAANPYRDSAVPGIEHPEGLGRSLFRHEDEDEAEVLALAEPSSVSPSRAAIREHREIGAESASRWAREYILQEGQHSSRSPKLLTSPYLQVGKRPSITKPGDQSLSSFLVAEDVLL